MSLSDAGEKLYQELLKTTNASPEGLKKVFFQEDLAAFASDAAGSVAELMSLVAELSQAMLFRTSKLGGRLCWSIRPQSAAKAIKALNADEQTVYTYVEEAHEKGIWIKDVKKRTNINPTVVQKAMAKLESSRLVKSVKNVRNPAQKTYILFHLSPSEDVTGGSFFDAGDLDESLIEELSNLIIFHVRQQSWVDQKSKRPRRDLTPLSDDDEDDDHRHRTNAVHGKKRKLGASQHDTIDIEDSIPAPSRSALLHKEIQNDPVTAIVYPAYTRTYPTTASIHNFITTTDAIRATKAETLTVSEIQDIINVLVWDDKLEQVGTGGYRTVRGVNFRPPGFPTDEPEGEDGEGWAGNALTQAPCGRCPVFDLCHDSGPINAGSCTYFSEWLGDSLD
ncbi:Hypothetical protein R9X50_00370200 [Acrodontium crateriforme]|uniref:DNA-directed RNA polymerase III subunit RPC6 n=1 Tax=Acrodontium crateriforme TaxID=150365 RepID=A0AAQ3R9M3_9PEZI|nr:Hypothetical protein R9X50_00370200 [Acrodontium crateriforme]